jgi:ABC-type multidrug transport system ATPase subunit
LAAVFRLPQDRRALAEALSKESQASLTLAQALFDEPSVQCELAEVAPEDTLTGARP